MNLMTSIFGGMILTAVLYGGMRLFRVGNFWSAVAAGGLPSVAYIAYAVLNWPGLDAVTMHIVAYPTVAIVLAMLYDRRRGEGMHWAPRLIVLLFMGATVLFGSLVYIASHGLPTAVAQWFLPDAKGKTVHTGFAGVVAHYEEAAKGVRNQLKIENKLARLGWQIEVSGLDQLTAGQAREVGIYLRDANGRGLDEARVNLAFGHPGQPALAGQILSGAGVSGYRGTALLETAGTWVVFLEIEAAGEQINLEHTIEVR